MIRSFSAFAETHEKQIAFILLGFLFLYFAGMDAFIMKQIMHLLTATRRDSFLRDKTVTISVEIMKFRMKYSYSYGTKNE